MRVVYGAYARLVFNFSVGLDNSCVLADIMDTSSVRQFIEKHNGILKLCANRVRVEGGWTVIEIIDLCEKLFDGVDMVRGELKDWCRRFWHENKAILWVFRAHMLGSTLIKNTDRGFRNGLMDEFKMPGFELFFQKGARFKEYSFSYVDAIEYMEDLAEKVPRLPEVVTIHEGLECEYYDWWDECNLCFKRDREIEKKKEALLAQSNNIFLNPKIRQMVFLDFIKAVREGSYDGEGFREYISNWSLLPILDVRPYSAVGKYIVTDRADVYRDMEKQLGDIFAPGKTPRQICEAWVDIVMRYYYFSTHYAFRSIHDPLFRDYELFFDVFYNIEVMDMMLERQRECAQSIRDMF